MSLAPRAELLQREVRTLLPRSCSTSASHLLGAIQKPLPPRPAIQSRTRTSYAWSGRPIHTSAAWSRAPVPSHPIVPPRPVGTGYSAGNVATGSSTGHGGSGGAGKKKSQHMVWYREIVPAMIPIILLSTTLFLSLSLLRTHLSHQKSLAESETQIAALEAELARLRREAKRIKVRERRERERMLPLVVERVLQKVGARRAEQDDEEVDESGKGLSVDGGTHVV